MSTRKKSGENKQEKFKERGKKRITKNYERGKKMKNKKKKWMNALTRWRILLFDLEFNENKMRSEREEHALACLICTVTRARSRVVSSEAFVNEIVFFRSSFVWLGHRFKVVHLHIRPSPFYCDHALSVVPLLSNTPIRPNAEEVVKSRLLLLFFHSLDFVITNHRHVNNMSLLKKRRQFIYLLIVMNCKSRLLKKKTWFERAKIECAIHW